MESKCIQTQTPQKKVVISTTTEDLPNPVENTETKIGNLIDTLMLKKTKEDEEVQLYKKLKTVL